jgi:hypothetical protein
MVFADSDNILNKWKLYWLPHWETKKGNGVLEFEKGCRNKTTKSVRYVCNETENVTHVILSVFETSNLRMDTICVCNEEILRKKSILNLIVSCAKRNYSLAYYLVDIIDL